MKKLLSLLCILSLLFTLYACSLNVNIKDYKTGDYVSSNTDNNLSKNEDLSENDTNSEFVRGVINELNYESKFIGLGCTLGSDWNFYTEEQLKELDETTNNTYNTEINNKILYDMLAVDDSYSSMISIHMYKTSNAALQYINMEKYLKSSCFISKQQLNDQGITDISYVSEKILIDEKEFDCVHMDYKLQGIDAYEKIIGIKCDGYIACISVFSYDKNEIENILDYFYII